MKHPDFNVQFKYSQEFDMALITRLSQLRKPFSVSILFLCNCAKNACHILHDTKVLHKTAHFYVFYNLNKTFCLIQ